MSSLFGVETEYALSATDSRGVRLPQGEILDRLLLRARRDLTYLPDGGQGMFLPNASRFYIDCGGHPELATAECGDPWELVRHVRAGEAILLRLADADGGRRSSGRLLFFRCNVDYSGTNGGAVWGLHESYLHHLEPEALPAELIPHLVSRLIYTGAGGFVNTAPGLEFVLSPRTPHLVRDVSRDSTSNRGIFHDKRAHLAGGGHHRLHVLCGESLCSDLATWLRAGTTALVVALAEAGLRPGRGVMPRDPVAAMQTFARDPTCRARVPIVGGEALTAIDIQWHYLTLAEAHLESVFMPSWAGTVCRQWRAMLDRLAAGWEAVATTLDWAIKLGLYRQHAERRGVAWDTLADWTPAIAKVAEALGRVRHGGRSLTAAVALGSASPIAAELQSLRAAIERLGLDWERLGAVLDLRHELFEIDVRFGQIGERGIFTTLAAAGVLQHAVAGTGEVATAIDHPPGVPRARVRGELVRALSGQSRRYLCGWQGVWDREEDRWVDLGDPFSADATWRPRARDPEALLPLRFRSTAAERLHRRRGTDDEAAGAAIALSNRALGLRKRDRFAGAERLLRRAIAIEDAEVAPDSPKRAHRRNNLTLVLLRAGRLDAAVASNVEAWALKTGRHDLTSGRILFARVALHLMRGSTNVGCYLGQLKTLFAGPLECHGNVTRTWDIPDVVTTLSDHLEAVDADLLADLAEVLNDRRRLPVLDAHERWVSAEPVALDHPWPPIPRPR